MTNENILFALAASIITLGVLWFFWKKERLATALELRQHIAEARDLEKRVHVREREFLNEKNEIEVAKAEAMRAARAAGYEEGRAFGQAENQRDHLIEMTALRSEFSQKLGNEREAASSEARDKLRAEYELQTKLFTVKICPYLRIAEDKSLFNKKHELISGYQYQLLINGIPAFAPHVVPERTEIHSEINPEIERALLGIAEKAADAAINLYLGGNIQFAKLSPAKVDRVAR